MKRLLGAGTMAVLCAAIFCGAATATSPTPASGTIWSPNQHVDYRWKEGSEPPSWMRAAVNAAAQDSDDSRAARAAILGYDSNASSWISYTADLPTNWAIGYTVRNVPGSFNMRLRPQGFALDWGNLRWCQFYDSPPNGCYDAEMVALHELGHAQTLGHADEADVTNWTDTVMHAAPKTKAKAGWNAHEFGRCDVARLQIRYEPLKSTTPYSTCLDLPTDLSLSASSSTIAYNGVLQLTARLTVDNSAAYASLAGNAIDGRHVTIQRRSPNASSWSTVGTMAALSDGAGRYQFNSRITSTYDWRAVFGSPSDEGLEGSSSTSVRVTVSYDCSSTNSLVHRGPAYETC